MRRRAWTGAAGALTIGALTIGALTLPAQRPAASLDIELRPGEIIVPRQRPEVAVRLRSPRPERVSTSLVDADDRELARGRPIRLRPGRAGTRALQPTALGRRELGRCGARRVILVARAAGGRERRVATTTTSDALRCAPLRWAPPALEAPTTLALDTGYTQLRLDDGRDYILRLPRGRKLGGTVIEGGRNVVIVGGHITLPPGTTSELQRRGLYFKSQTGTVHVEGVLIDGSGGGHGDGIAINAPAAVVQIQNSRVVGLRGSEAGVHADVVQPWGGVRELRIDRLTGSSHFQGLFLPQSEGPIGTVVIGHADLRALPPLKPQGGGGHMLFLTLPGPAGCTTSPLTLSDVYVVGRTERRIDLTVWPGVDDGSPCAARRRGTSVGWPALAVEGTVREGVPDGGDYVPRHNVGTQYRSPGYAE